jgi:CxxC motif-containing protein (DUF1111 family)
MKVNALSRSLWLALLLVGAGCGAAVAPVAQQAEPEGDLDEVSALSERREPLQASFGDPLPRLPQADLDRFAAGKVEFETDEEPADGLGPVFNDTSCARCHSAPAVGGGSAILETRFGAATFGRFDPLAELGGSLIQAKGIGPAGNCVFQGETVPPQANVVSQRRTTPLFGLGLVDAVPESTFHLVALIEAGLFPAEAGRPAMVRDIARGRDGVGRFGWKGQVPSLHQFAGDAYLNEMGVTSPEFPDENCPNGDCALLACNPRPDLNDDGSGVVAFADFMTLLAPPPRARLDRQASAGKGVFSALGCTRCHWATFRTGNAALPSLGRVTFHPYSDFLLHDMGGLGDGIETGDARGNEFRTAPLWGTSALTRFLHDGRAGTLAEAILAHDGQARRARDRFADLSPSEQEALIAFLRSL